jgi:ATP-binding cassette subfamily F protein 3
MLSVENVSKAVGARPLFSGVSLTLNGGDRVGLVGPNGKGKSTLLEIIAGEETPDTGQVRGRKGLRLGALWQEPPAGGDTPVLAEVLSGDAELTGLQSRLKALERRMAEPGAPGVDVDALVAEYGTAHDRFEALGGYRREAEARKVLAGLGFSDAEMDRPCGTFSGGWRMRVSLARLLVTAPDVLLLDEPTNHLDTPAVEWLEAFLSGYAGAVLAVSHDRDFLNAFANRIAAMLDSSLRTYKGNYDAFLAQREQEREVEENRARNQRKEAERMQAFVDRFRYKATKARQAQSRVKQLARMEPVEVPKEAPVVDFAFPPTTPSAKEVLVADGLAKAFEGSRVFKDFAFTLFRGDKVALVGPNGVGKSTLLKILAGAEDPDAGTVTLGHKVRRAYFAQHTLDTLSPVHSAYEEVQAVAPKDPVARIRGILGRFLLTGEEQLKKVAVLSGGEKARVALARLLIRPANLLLLDEPTNHLDIPSRDVLEDALTAYDGTLVMVTHDRHLIRKVANRVLEIQHMGRAGGRLIDHPGGWGAYLAEREGAAPAATAPPPKAEQKKAPKASDAPKPGGAERTRRKEAARDERKARTRMAEIEAKLAEAEPELAALAARLADPALYADDAAFREVLDAHAALERRVERLTAEWDALAEGLPA